MKSAFCDRTRRGIFGAPSSYVFYVIFRFCWVAQLIRVMIHFGTPVADYERAVEHVKDMNIYDPEKHPRYVTKYESSNKNTKDEGAENVELSVKSPSESVNTDDLEEP